MIAIQRPPAHDENEHHFSQMEPEHIVLQTVERPPTLPSIDTERVPAVRHEVPRRRGTVRLDTPDQSSMPARRPMADTGPSQVPPFVARPIKHGRLIPALLTLSCIFFLIASGILAFILMGNKPTLASASLQVAPDLPLRVGDAFRLTGKGFGNRSNVTFTHDTKDSITDSNGNRLGITTDSTGTFGVQIRVPLSWHIGDNYIHATDETLNLSVSTKVTVIQPPPGPPHLQLAQLAQSRINLGNDRAGTDARSTLTLINTGGGQISWRSNTDATWLSITPNNDTFNGSELVNVIGNRGGLKPKAYTGHITFKPQNGSSPIVVTVTMTVNPQPAALVLSTAALTFSTTTGQAAPPAQAVTLSNNGGQTLNWSSNVSTTDGANWLALSARSGSIEPGQNQSMLVSVLPGALAAGQYQGAINFTGGANAQVSITLIVIAPNVVAPGNLIVSLSSLTFTATAGQSAAPKPILLQNTGGSNVNWTATLTTTDKGKWLSSNVVSGTISPAATTTVNITANASALAAASYQGTITFTTGTISKDVSVVFTVIPQPQPAIGVPVTPLNFSTYKGQNPAPQTFTVSNPGTAALNWIATEDGNGATFAPVTPTHGLIAPGGNVVLTVTPNMASITTAGVQTTTITIADSDAGTTVPSQKIVVSITVLDQPNMVLQSTALNLTLSAGLASTSTLFTISNTGSQDLNWTITPDAAASWLTFNATSGTVAAGGSQTIEVLCTAGQLTAGTYTASFTAGDSDTGTPVKTQTVQVTFTIS